MERRHTPVAPERRAARPEPSGTVHDDRWAGAARCATGCATLLLTLLLVVDDIAGGLTAVRAVVWTALAVLLFVVLLPARVSATKGRLVSRGLLREHSVRTDRLVSVLWSDGVTQRLILRDTDGGRVELDPRVLVATPQLWRRLDEDTRVCLRDGTLRSGTLTLHRLAHRLDGRTAQLVFKQSGLD